MGFTNIIINIGICLKNKNNVEIIKDRDPSRKNEIACVWDVWMNKSGCWKQEFVLVCVCMEPYLSINFE